ncbi:N-acetylmuramoyl-L-alanine amidase [Lactobacillus sp. DCY120]|uniref:N-acetylmuramoyl-L-alanine amidase n=1 Tax=Bombilactobacillus apium TaxID=2675299 RepID=A0A850R5H2_9LACO|nr:N-acetylmuramoyl-L-alanine amidase [Bombilactobacillus apium]NVY95852.1 N-acetylmuramoyl-L-alanine amidase [Bombilactobacillus apium]
MKRSKRSPIPNPRVFWTYLVVLGLILLSGVSTLSLAQDNQVVVKAKFLNVRMGPSLAYSTIMQVKRGETLTILSKKNQWYQVRLAGDRIGWVASWLIENGDVNTSHNTVGVIKAVNTEVYKYAEKNSEVLGTLNQGQHVNVVYTQKDWNQILYQNTVAWVPDSAILMTDQVAQKIKDPTPNSQQATVNIQSVTTLQNNTKIYKQANERSEVVAHVPDQTTLPYLGTEHDFYKVKLNSGDTGYLYSRLVSISDNKHQIKSAATNLSEATIVIDPGHGGRDTGALSESQKGFEKNYTLDVASRLQQHLKKSGANVILTRSKDQFVDLAERARLSNKLNADAFISIHFDSTPKGGQATGLTTYYYSAKKDQRLANQVNQQLRGLPISNRGIRTADFEVTRENEQPAILVEGGYINNPHDFKQIKSEHYRDQLAAKIATGLANYFK